MASTQKYLNILAIRDGMVVLQDGGIRTILEVGSLNFALKSEEEQGGMLFSYQQFLNSLKFPIQIVMQSRRLDLYGYLKMLRELLEKQTNDLIRIQNEEYINFIERLLTKANIMDKKFYVVVPYFPSGIEKSSMIDKVLGGAANKGGGVHYTKDQFQEFKTQLSERVNVISGGLGSMGLKVHPLETQQIIELLYGMYNPAEAISERMTDVTNLGSDVVSTDMPVQMASQKEDEIVDEELKKVDNAEANLSADLSTEEIIQDLPVVNINQAAPTAPINEVPMPAQAVDNTQPVANSVPVVNVDSVQNVNQNANVVNYAEQPILDPNQVATMGQEIYQTVPAQPVFDNQNIQNPMAIPVPMNVDNLSSAAPQANMQAVDTIGQAPTYPGQIDPNQPVNYPNNPVNYNQ